MKYIQIISLIAFFYWVAVIAVFGDSGKSFLESTN